MCSGSRCQLAAVLRPHALDNAAVGSGPLRAFALAIGATGGATSKCGMRRVRVREVVLSLVYPEPASSLVCLASAGRPLVFGRAFTLNFQTSHSKLSAAARRCCQRKPDFTKDTNCAHKRAENRQRNDGLAERLRVDCHIWSLRLNVVETGRTPPCQSLQEAPASAY